jgi:acetylornithine/succinyldiaminopimelate/putrescine aminotransferase
MIFLLVQHECVDVHAHTQVWNELVGLHRTAAARLRARLQPKLCQGLLAVLEHARAAKHVCARGLMLGVVVDDDWVAGHAAAQATFEEGHLLWASLRGALPLGF